MKILGIDPGLQRTGWGMVRIDGNHMSFLACGVAKSDASAPLSKRLMALSEQISHVIGEHRPDAAAIEETFVNKNGQSTLKLGQARGALLLTLAQCGLPTEEYAAREVKKAITGSGAADKTQVTAMVARLLPGSSAVADAADALAVALCHGQMAAVRRVLETAR